MEAASNPSGIYGLLADEPDFFSSIRAELRKQATALLEKGMKGKSFTLEALRVTFNQLGERQFLQALSGFKELTLRSLVKKFDPNHANAKAPAKSIDAAWAKQRLLEIANGAVPVEKIVALDKLLPAKERTIERLAALQAEMGPERFAAAIEAMTDAAARTLAKKLDPGNPNTKGAAKNIDARWARRRIAEVIAVAGSAGDRSPGAGASCG